MKWINWGIQLLIPLVVLYTIGYYVSGFSALTIPWLITLSILIFIGERIVYRVLGKRLNRVGIVLIDFLVATIIIFMATLMIQGGSVPLGGALLAAAIIAILAGIVGPENNREKVK